MTYCTATHCPAKAEKDAKLCKQHLLVTTESSQEVDRVTGFHHFRSDQERMEKLLKVEGEKVESDEWREPLAYGREESIYILLSTGGGEDGYKIYFRHGEVSHGEYVYKDWGTCNTYALTESELQTVIDVYMYGDPSSFLEQV